MIITTRLHRIISLTLVFCLVSCGGGGSGGSGGGSGTGALGGSTINAHYIKGPVTGAEAWLVGETNNIVAGPVLTVNGVATFPDVDYAGMVYARFNGGSYTDEATGIIVNLTNAFTIRSGLIDITGPGTVAINASPLTEIGFRRAEISIPSLVDQSGINGHIDQVADEYGLDGINLTTVTPARLDAITGTTENDLYGTVLAAITQQQLDAGDAPSAMSLQSYIAANTTGVDQAAFMTAVNNLQTNSNTSPYINAPIINMISTQSGYSGISDITFQVDMGNSYQGSVSMAYITEGQSTPTVISMLDSDLDGIYDTTLSLDAGQQVAYQFIQGPGGTGVWENVPANCSTFIINTQMRTHFVRGTDETLWPAPFAGCAPDLNVCVSAPGRSVPISVSGLQVLVGQQPLHMKGVSWSPVPLGQGPASSNQFSTAVVQDAQLMSVAGINVVRTYRPILDETVLDELWSQGIYVMMTVFYGFGDTIDTALQNVCAVKDHPAVLGWIVGNEWNYTNLEQPISLSRAVTRVGQLIDAIKLNDPTRPASTVYGYLPPRAVLARLQNVDIWGSNVYTGPSFGSFFSQWEALSDKPIYLAEYGADAYDGTRGQVDETTQANILAGLTGEINNNASVNGQGPCAGGFAFEFNDEWWKFARGSWSQHDTTASWQSFGYPDPNMHEEWWGMVDIFRTPREAYFAYRDITAPVANSP